MGGHTPGPWAVTPDSFVMAGSRPSIGVARIITHAQEFVANARLIAAAPDLLEALKRMGYQGRDGWCFCCDIDGEESARHQGSCKIARAAIAKAEGR